MTKRLQVYDTPDITVTFDPNLCQHSGVCLMSLPAVFDVRRSRWVQPEAADPARVAAAIQKCPSGALQFYRNVSRDPIAAASLARKRLLNRLAVLVGVGEARDATAKELCAAILDARGYDFAGLYDVAEGEVRLVGYSGATPPENPRFPADRGLCGAAAESGETVIANDVSVDARYIPTSAATRAEMIVPVVEPATREVLGTIDVAANRAGAFGAEDRDLVEDCARAMLAFWTEQE